MHRRCRRYALCLVALSVHETRRAACTLNGICKRYNIRPNTNRCILVLVFSFGTSTCEFFSFSRMTATATATLRPTVRPTGLLRYHSRDFAHGCIGVLFFFFFFALAALHRATQKTQGNPPSKPYRATQTCCLHPKSKKTQSLCAIPIAVHSSAAPTA